MATRQQQLLDELDEARIVAKSYRRGWLWIGFAAVMAMAMVLTGAVVGMWSTAAKVDFGGQATLFVIIGILGMPVTAATGAAWFNRFDAVDRCKRIPSPAARLRAAERAYRNHVMEES